MHQLLTKWLAKRGIQSPEDLDSTPMPDGSPTEREVFEKYRQDLSKEELTLEDVKDFCLQQVDVIEAQWSNYAVSQSVKAEFIPYYTVYKAIYSAIGSPRSRREAIEKQLELLTK